MPRNSSSEERTRGSTVIDGHVDYTGYGLGALYALYNLGPGDPVTVTATRCAQLTYRCLRGVHI